MRTLVLATVLVLTAASAPAAARPIADCPLFPASNPWNQRVDDLPRAAGSAVMVERMGITHLHPDFSDADADGYGIPYQVVGSDTPRRRVTFDYADESDPGPYPIPRDPLIEGGSDRHLLALDRDDCTLYELFAARQRADGSWHAGSGAIFDLDSNGLRPAGWTSADAAGLPILPGLARYPEVAAGGIDHALRITIPVSQRAYLWPARHHASSRTEPWLPPMGLRLRVKASFDINGFGPQTRAILRAGKRYGFIVADNGSGGYITGAPHRGWDDDDLHSLHDVPASALEVVDTSSLPGHPGPRKRNVRIRVRDGVVRARLLHTARGPLSLEAVRDGEVVRRVRRDARQGYVRLRMDTVPGASYRVRLR